MQNYTDEIIAKFPKIQCSVLNGGVNVYYGRYTITIWWKKQMYCDTKKYKWVRFTSLEAIIQVVEAASMPKAKKVAHIEPQAIETDDLIALFHAHAKEQGEIAKEQLDAYCDHKSKQGVNNCIQHILAKREFILKSQPDNKLVAFCQTLIDELKQYL